MRAEHRARGRVGKTQERPRSCLRPPAFPWRPTPYQAGLTARVRPEARPRKARRTSRHCAYRKDEGRLAAGLDENSASTGPAVTVMWTGRESNPLGGFLRDTWLPSPGPAAALARFGRGPLHCQACQIPRSRSSCRYRALTSQNRWLRPEASVLGHPTKGPQIRYYFVINCPAAWQRGPSRGPGSMGERRTSALCILGQLGSEMGRGDTCFTVCGSEGPAGGRDPCDLARRERGKRAALASSSSGVSSRLQIDPVLSPGDRQC